MVLKYVKIINEISGLCEVGTGSSIECYRSLGMIEREVELSDNGIYYLTGYAPKKPLEEQMKNLKEFKKQKLKEARNQYLILNGYNFSENDKFNLMNLLNNYTEKDRYKYIEFLKYNIIPKYNNFSETIDNSKVIEELKKLNFNFNEEEENKNNSSEK